MSRRPKHAAERLWRAHDLAWRDPAQVVGQWDGAAAVDARLLACRVSGSWWDVLRSAGITLLVTREYEHLVMALGADDRGPRLSFFPLPHPSGIAVDRARSRVHIASTRNPNQVLVLEPAGASSAGPGARRPLDGAPLLPVHTTFFPGSLYLHDIAFLGGALLGSAVGRNAIVSLGDDGRHAPVWWPRCIDTPKGPAFERNYLQLNSIAAGPSLEQSYFSASTDERSRRRPGHRNFPVDRRGVVFAGATREPMARGLTRPHSARIHDARVWVANSGYGEIGVCASGRFEPVAGFGGWTRGLCFCGPIAFVGTSRVLPRFRGYAPGLRVERASCGVQAVDVASGRILGGLTWPSGNQVFACDWIAAAASRGFPLSARGARGVARARQLFFTGAAGAAPARDGR